MHIETYEWALYLTGQLSERRMSEIEAHLRSCDRCLEAYAALASGEARLEAAVKPARGSFWRVFANRRRRPVFAMAAAALCVLLVVLSTPGGKIVWGQFTRTLRGWFAIQSHPELVETLDVPAVSHHGVEMKLNEVLIEDNRVYFSLLVSAEKEINNFSHQIGQISKGLKIGDQYFDVFQEWDYSSQNPARDENEFRSTILVVLRAEVPAEMLEKDNIRMSLTIDHISGVILPVGQDHQDPWRFDFTVDGSKVKELTRVIPLDHEFRDDQSTYHVTELVFSPIRAKISLSRTESLKQKYLEIYGSETWVALDYGNLLGFVVKDDSGNQIEISQVESGHDSELKETEFFIFYSNGKNNGWNWLKDAESVTLTPYFITLAGPENNAGGIARFHEAVSLTISLK